MARKDNDLLDGKIKFNVGLENKKKLMAIIEKDKELFQKCNIIDYSLLVGIYDIEARDPNQDQDDNQLETLGNMS